MWGIAQFGSGDHIQEQDFSDPTISWGETPYQKYCVSQINDLILFEGIIFMLPALNSQETRLHELRDKRKPISERFRTNPSHTRLALELKIIDDQIAECNQQIQADRR